MYRNTAVVEVFPPNNTIDYRQDISLEVTFNKPVKLEDYVYENGNLKNIQITHNGENLLDNSNGKKSFYSNAYLKNDGKTLVIPVTKGLYLFSNGDSQSIKDIDCKLNLRNLTDAEGVPFVSEEYLFSYCLNSNKDSIPPVINKLWIAKTETDARNGTNLISFDEFTHYAAKANYGNDSKIVTANIENHHLKSVWINVEADDADSGVDGIEIKEQLIRKTDTTGNNLTGQIQFNRNNNPNTNMFYNSSNGNLYNDCFEYNFMGTEDGVVHLDFIVTDRAGKTAAKSSDLIKDTECTVTVEVRDDKAYDSAQLHVNEGPDYHSYTYSVPLRPKKNDIKFCTDMDGKAHCDTFYGVGYSSNPATDVDFSVVNMELVSFEWGYDENNMQSAELQFKDDSRYVYWNRAGSSSLGWTNAKLHPKITVDPFKKIYVRGTVRDSAGNTSNFSDTLAETINVVSAKYESNKWNINCDKAIFGSDSHSHRYYVVTKTIDGTVTRTDIYRGGSGPYATNPISSGLGNPSSWNDCIKEIYYCNSNKPLSRDDSFWAVTGIPFIIRKENGSVTYGNGSTINANNALPNSTQFSLTEGPAVLNSGMQTVRLNFSNFTPINGISYYLDCYAKDTSGVRDYDENFYLFPITDFTKETVFSISVKQNTYYFKIIADNGASQRIESTEKSITFENDTVPPNLHDIYGIYNGVKVKPSEFVINTLSSFIKDDSAIDPDVKYFFADSPYVKWDSNVVLNTSTISGGNIVSFYAEAGFKPYLYLQVKDIHGNTTKYVQKYGYEYIQREPTFSASSTSAAKVTMNLGIYSNYKVYFQSFETNGNTQNWVDSSVTIPSSNVSEKYFTTGKTSFVRFNVYDAEYSGSITTMEYSDIYYFYPPKYFSGSTLRCNLKDYILGNIGITIFVDQPCLVHTFYNSRNLGNDMQAWFNNGIEAKVQCNSSTFTYEEPEISSGKFYTTIIHFADGTTKMLPVKQK